MTVCWQHHRAVLLHSACRSRSLLVGRPSCPSRSPSSDQMWLALAPLGLARCEIPTRFASRELHNPAFCSARVTSKRVSLSVRYIQTRARYKISALPECDFNVKKRHTIRVSLRVSLRVRYIQTRARYKIGALPECDFNAKNRHTTIDDR